MKPGSLNSAFLPRETLEALGFAHLGADVLVHSTCVLVDCGKISLGSRVRIDPFVVVSTRGGLRCGDNVHIGSHSVIAGQASVTFGDFVNISHHVGIYTSSEDFSGRTLSNPTLPEAGPKRTASVFFGPHSGVGAGSLVLPGARFSEGAVLGAMSRTGRPLRAWTIYAGVPARRSCERHRDVLHLAEDYRRSLARNDRL